MRYREKQSESLEIRLGHSAKQDFMAACRARGLTASEVVRDFVEAYPVERQAMRWPVLKSKLTEPVMSLSTVFLLSAVLGTSAILPTAATADREDPVAQFQTLDSDGDGSFVLADLYQIAGLTAQGRFTASMRDDVVAMMYAAIEDLDMLAQAPVLNPEFIERTVAQAETGAVRGVNEAFDDIDTNGDGRVTRAEFLDHWEAGTRQFGSDLPPDL